ncbi:23S rRNA pseudouridine(1911/1915/1917) synthase RluD [Thauera linaloolentis]|uniref:23S rRNA pseudouridine(1911/1915/1917) synthase RluD n=1 Tax=Thauera linaloolentis TaxID=76112 RepID=UPI0003120B0C|nr:23S rRNA pseudouridine(1911/1915/1917) synthase RluD [Thauera linaloolentis]MCM8564674.1 23S rRNA pseudouridine(1911/1915/1917) synthase RluD [Thauera linaloolentis]
MNERVDYIAADEPNSPVVLTIPADLAGLRLDQALARLFPEHSRSRLQTWLRDGRIRVDGVSPDARCKVCGGERVELDSAPVPAPGTELPEDIPLQVVFEDAHLLVIDKPAGLVVHPGSGNWSGTLLNALLHHAPGVAEVPRAGIVHRLDKDTSGLLVVAKTLQAQTDLVRQLQARTVKRHYWALVQGVLHAGGTVDAPIGRHPTQRVRMAVVGNGRPAVTHYSVAERFAKTTLVECRLETGRTHQIRVHMAHIGHALVGDPVYGGRRPPAPACEGFARQALHAFRLGLVHPASGQFMQWEAPMAADLAALLQRVRESA